MTDQAVRNRYLEGNFAPVAEEVTAFDLPVDGVIPPELNGRFLRIGPNPVLPEDPATYHWFTGTGMVHGVRLRDGSAEWYRNRFVVDGNVSQARGRPEAPGPRRGPFDGANTNVIGHAGKTFAIVEAGAVPVELSYELETICRTDFGGTLPAGFTAHPKVDPDTGDLHAVAYYWEWQHLQYVHVGADGAVKKTVDVPVPGSPMAHDCAITERYVVLFDLPVTFSLDAVMAGARLPYQWTPDYGARVGLLPRDGGADDVRWFDVDLCYVFHPLNAYDLPGGEVVLDVVRHPSMFATELLGPNEGVPTLERWTIDPLAGKVREERIDDRGQEFPRHDERLIGKPHRYAYTANFGPGVEHGPLLKHDLVAGTTETHEYGTGRVTLEAVFVPRADGATEDDGYVMSYVYDATSDSSDVVVLSAQDFTGDPLATIRLPQRVPFGFHGNWVPDA